MQGLPQDLPCLHIDVTSEAFLLMLACHMTAHVQPHVARCGEVASCGDLAGTAVAV